MLLRPTISSLPSNAQSKIKVRVFVRLRAVSWPLLAGPRAPPPDVRRGEGGARRGGQHARLLMVASFPGRVETRLDIDLIAARVNLDVQDGGLADS